MTSIWNSKDTLEIKLRDMDYKKHRIYGYSFTLFVHFANLVYLAINLPPTVFEDPKILMFKDLQSRFFTVWTFVLQIVYAGVCLTYELMDLEKSKSTIVRHVKDFRNIAFSCILWPCCWVVAIVFWSLYLYDIDLIFPENTKELVHPISNHIMHTFIVPVVIWEIIYRPLETPKSHRNHIYRILFHFASYFAVLTYTYKERGFWIYPVFTKLYGTIYFPLIHTTVTTTAIAIYFIQWPLTKYLWRNKAQKLE